MTAIHKFVKCLKTESFRMIVTPKTYIAVILVTMTYFLNVFLSGLGFRPGADGVYYLYLARYSQISKLLIICLTFAFSVTYLEDLEHKYMLSYMIRSGVRAYSLAKITMSFICSWIVSFYGVHLFLGLLSLKIPFISEWSYQICAQELPYGVLINSKVPYLYVFITASIISSSFAFWTVTGLLISTFCSNIFVTVGLPVMLNYYITEFTSYIPVPKILNSTYISLCQDVGLGIVGDFVYSVIFFILLSALAGIVFCKRVKGSISGEIN